MRCGGQLLPFSALYALRSHLYGQRALSLFTCLAIATSVALATGLELATRSIERELGRSADSLAGAARLEISAGGAGVPESLLEAVAAEEGVAVAAPLVLATFHVPLADGTRMGLRVLGVDFLSERDVRGYSLEDPDVEIGDELRLVSQLDSLIVTRSLAGRLGLALGERLEVYGPAGRLELRVRGILRPGGVADAYGGQIAAMDVYALAAHLGRPDLFDRIDVVPAPGIDLDELRARLALRVQGIASVRRPDSRDEFAEQVFGTVSAGVWGVACIGVLVASLLSYGTLSLSVDARLREFALLQAAGLEPRRVRRMLRVDVALLAGMGTALGLGLGRILGGSFFDLLSRLSAQNDTAWVEAQELQMTPLTLGVAIGVGLIVSFAASIGPQRRATSCHPLDVLRQEAGAAPRTGSTQGTARRRALALGALVLLGLLPLPVPAALRVALIYLGGVGALIAAARPLGLPLLARACRSGQDVVPSVGAFLGQSLLARPAQTALTLGILAAIVAGLVSIRVVLSSIEQSFGAWVGSRYRGGIVITAGDPYDRARQDPVSKTTLRAIRASAGVGEILESVNVPIRYRGEEVILFARTMSVLERRGSLSVLGGSWPELARALRAGKIAISDAFQRRFGVSAGERLVLDTPRGPRSFEIAAVVRDYYGTGGALHLDIAQFDAHWTRAGAAAVVIWPSSGEDPAIEAIRRSAGSDQLLFFTRSDDHARWVMRPFERFVSLLRLSSAFTLVLGGLALLTLLAGAVRQRRRELGFLRIAGATGRWLALLVLADSAILMSCGGLCGVALGIAASRPICDLLTEWLGWSVQWHVAWEPLGGILGLALAAALICAAYPAAVARRTRPVWSILGE